MFYRNYTVAARRGDIPMSSMNEQLTVCYHNWTIAEEGFTEIIL